MIRKNIVFLAALVALVLCSCRKEDVSSSRSSIRVKVSDDLFTKSETMTTSKLRASGHFVMDAFLDEDWRNFSVTDFATDPKYYDPSGIPVNKDKSDAAYAAGIYIDSGADYNVSYNSGSWLIDKTYYWVSNDLMRFFCYYPKEYSSTDAGKFQITTRGDKGTCSMVFRYELPEPGTGFQDASAQQDILFAYSQKKYENAERSTDDIDIKFNHPLSKVNFCVSPDDGTFDTNLEIVKISILGVKDSGICTFNGAGSISPVNPVDAMFTWVDATSPATTTQDYCQLYEAAFKSLPVGWEAGDILLSDGITPSGKTKYTCTNSFFMIPQTLDGASIEIEFGNTGTGDNIIRTLQIDNDVWKPGYYYTYKISATTIGRTIMVSMSLEDWDNYDDKLLF